MADGNDKHLAGSGGGKSGGRKPVEAPNTLHSIASAQVLDLVSEGPIVGFATPNPLESVYLDETPIANPDGSLNFKDVHVEYRFGTQDQEYIKGFPSVENEIVAGVTLRPDVPFVRSITNTDLSAVRVRLSVPGLSRVDEDTNDVVGYRINYAIDLADEIGGAYTNVLTTSFNGKTTSTYARSHRIDLPPTTTGWMLRVRRLTPQANSAVINDTTVVEATTEIIDAKLRYPNSALVGIKVNAEQFPSIPRRAFDLVGRIVRVPSNYDPIARTYDGIWDGTFKPEWTDNPAWIYYDAVLNPRYGLGHRISESQVDHWALYRIARICDELVPDGRGGLEPRYTCNIFIQQQIEAYRLLRDLASVFNGIAYYADNRVVAAIDAPSDAVVAYTNADVLEGRFTYTGSGKSTRATVALVTWYDPDDFYRPKIEPVVDDAGIARYGIEQIELIATGCASQGQAQRAGWWALLTGRLETESVSFTLGLNGTFAMPGQIIKIADAKRAGRRIGGRIVASTMNSVTVDAVPDVAPAVGDHLSAMLPSGLVQKRAITAVDGSTLTTEPFDAVPTVGGPWVLETDVLAASTWRVVSVTEAPGEGDGTDGMTFNISAVEHAPEKFAAIDGGVLIEGPPTTQVPGNVQLAPASVTLTAVERAGHVVASPTLNVAWPQTPGAVRYGVAYRRSDGEWMDLPGTTATSATIENVFAGTYLAQVWAYNAAGIVSGRTTSAPLEVADQTLPPGVVIEIQDDLEQAQLDLQQEIADRIAADLLVGSEAAADALAKANAARDEAMAAVNALAAEVGEIVNAPEWDSTTDYIAGWLVREGGSLYRAIVDNTNVQPSTNPATWERIGEYASLGEAVAAALSIATATADELEAEVQRINAIVARMPTGTGTLASEAMVADEVTALASADTALGQRIDTVSATIGRPTSIVRKGTFEDGDKGLWGGSSEAVAVSNHPSLSHALRVGSGSTAYEGSLSAAIPVTPGDIVDVEVDVNTFSNTGNSLVLVHWITADNSNAGFSTVATVAGGTSWQLALGGTTSPAPAGTARARIGLSGGASGYTFYNNVRATIRTAAEKEIAASVSAVETASVDRDNALGSRVGVVEARMPSGSGELATEARVTSVESASVSRDEALGTRVGVVEARMPAGSGALATNAQIVAEQNARASAVGAVASDLSGLSVTVGNQGASLTQLAKVTGSINAVVIHDPSFEVQDGSWSFGPGMTITYSGNAARTGYYFLDCAAGTGTRLSHNTGRFRVEAGQQLRLWAWLRWGTSAISGGTGGTTFGLRFFDESGADLSSNQNIGSIPHGSITNSFKKFEGIVTVPANAATANFYIAARHSTGGRVLVDDAGAEFITEGEAKFLASHTVALNVNGHISGTVNENDGHTSQFSIMANIFRVIGSAAEGMEWQDGYLRVYGSGYQRIIGHNFGASGQNLVDWFGPNVGAAAASKSNAVMWMDKTGNAYWGGSLSAGTMKNSAQSTNTLTVGNEIVVGPFSTNGNTRSVTISYSRLHTRTSSQLTTHGYTAGAGSNTARVRVYRKIGAAAETLWQTINATGTTDIINSSVDPDVCNQSWSGSITVNDTSSSAQTVTYRAVIDQFNQQVVTYSGTGEHPPNITANLALISVEQ